MKVKIPDKPTIWFCPLCGKWDSPKVERQRVASEHCSHRGVDLRICKGTMILLYSEEDIQEANNESR